MFSKHLVRMVMEPKYYVLRRWLGIPIWEYGIQIFSAFFSWEEMFGFLQTSRSMVETQSWEVRSPVHVVLDLVLLGRSNEQTSNIVSWRKDQCFMPWTCFEEFLACLKDSPPPKINSQKLLKFKLEEDFASKHGDFGDDRTLCFRRWTSY